MRSSRRRSLAIAVSAVISSAVINPSPVFAQGALEEVVVTAQRREQSIQEVPISLEAFSGATLAAQGLRTMEDVSAFSPSVVERLEVLRGPQPIAFGQNATAGAFSIISKKPGDEWQGDLNAEYGNWGRASFEGGVGGPITDTIGMRIAGQWDTLDGYIRDVVTGEMFPGSDERSARLTFVWTPSENFDATLKGEYARRRREGDGMAV
jgi:iron complex outermembrane receptor protein